LLEVKRLKTNPTKLSAGLIENNSRVLLRAKSRRQEFQLHVQ